MKRNGSRSACGFAVAVVAGASLLFPGAGQRCRAQASERPRSQQLAAAYSTEDDRALRYMARLRQDLATLLEQQRRLNARIEDCEARYRVQQTRIDALDREVQELNGRLQTVDQSWRTASSRLAKALTEEGAARQESIKEIIDEVSEQISGAVKKVRDVSGDRAGGRTYTVQAGDTLSAIGVAFVVSVQSIKQANSLDSDVIRVGQVLTIPASE